MPETITQAIVNITPIHKYSEMRPMMVTLRYNRNTANRHAPIATNVPGVTVMIALSQWRSACQYTVVSEGKRNPAYCARPIQPEAIESGALNVSCQIKRKAI